MKRKKLTRHQGEVFSDIVRQSQRSAGRFASSTTIGSRGACQHLEEKGYIAVEEVTGPRGGTTWRYRPV